MNEYFTALLDYCRENVESFDKRFSRAFCRHIERCIPIYLACPSFTDEVSDAIDEYCDIEDIEPNDIDIEEFFIMVAYDE